MSGIESKSGNAPGTAGRALEWRLVPFLRGSVDAGGSMMAV